MPRTIRLTAVKDPLGHISNFEYDNMGAIIKVTDPISRVTQLTRDTLSRVIGTLDPQGNSTSFVYDAASNLTRVTDAIGAVTNFTYTGGGAGDLLETVKDANNQTTTFAYDLQKRLTSVTNPVDGVKHFSYDQKGNLTEVIDANGNHITFDYDALDRLTAKHLPNGEGEVTYTYDNASNLVTVLSLAGNNTETSKIVMTYGILNQITGVDQTIGGNTYTIGYTYDKNGNRTGMTTPWDNYSYAYNPLNQLVSLTSMNDSKTISFTYDALGRRTSLTLPNGTATTYAYDAASQLEQILHRKTTDSTALAIANYSYDNAGNRTSMSTLEGTHNYAYDNIYRLVSASHPNQPDEVFSYDPAGNRKADAVMTNYQYNAANRLQSNSAYNYAYDNNGNLTDKTAKVGGAHTIYVYDSANQLRQVTMPDNTIATYKYDPLGRRIEKTVNGVATRYVYDNEDIIAILDGSNSVVARFTHGPGVDEPLIMKKADGANYYYHADGLGSIVALSDDTGAIVETVEYEVYGKPLLKAANGVAIANSTVGNFQLFTAREYDFELGLYNLRARELDPLSGIFLQEDPKPHVNNYKYAKGNPVMLRDPYGENPLFIVLIFGILYFAFDNPANAPEYGGATYGSPTITDENMERLLMLVAAGLAARGATADDISYPMPPSNKILRQMPRRGWTDKMIKEAVKTGKKIPAVNKATNGAATRYIHPGTGQSMVVDDATKEIIHVGGPGFKYCE